MISMDWVLKRWKLCKAGKSKLEQMTFPQRILILSPCRRFDDKYLVVGKLVSVSESEKEKQKS